MERARLAKPHADRCRRLCDRLDGAASRGWLARVDCRGGSQRVLAVLVVAVVALAAPPAAVSAEAPGSLRGDLDSFLNAARSVSKASPAALVAAEEPGTKGHVERELQHATPALPKQVQQEALVQRRADYISGHNSEGANPWGKVITAAEKWGQLQKQRAQEDAAQSRTMSQMSAWAGSANRMELEKAKAALQRLKNKNVRTLVCQCWRLCQNLAHHTRKTPYRGRDCCHGRPM